MKMRIDIVKILAALVGLLYVSVALAAPPDGKGKPDDGSGNEPPDYGDLYILLRDVSGVPILTPGDLGECTATYPTAGTGCCQQPLAAEPFLGCLYPDGTVGDPGDTNYEECIVIPVDPDYCTVESSYVTLTQEPEFNRLNEMRSPDAVFESQLQDVTFNLATAGCISLDPAGRLVASTKVGVNDNGTVETEDDFPLVETSTIDSPLGNLAIYRELMLRSSLGETIDTALQVLMGDDWQLITAARGIGAASGKADGVSVDMVAYINQFMGLIDIDPALQATPLLPLIDPCIYPREEVMGVMQTVEKCFLDYGEFEYGRDVNFSGLPNPPYIPDMYNAEINPLVDLSLPTPTLGVPIPGTFEYSVVTTYPYFQVVQGLITAAPVPEWGSTEETANIGGFASAADDTRAVINFMHTWPVPGDYASKYYCNEEGGDFFDVYISADSGLQVPINMTSGTARGGTVTVVNGGPGDAVVDLTVTGDILNVGPIVFCDEELTETEEGYVCNGDVIAWPIQFELAKNETMQVPFYFTAESDAKTQIVWNANAAPTCAECDVIPENNTVDATTTLNKSGGGGGGGQGGGNPND
jgi:hypothetical protein